MIANTFEFSIDWTQVSSAMDELAHKGWTVIDGFLSPSEVQLISNHIEDLKKNNQLSPARIGKDSTLDRKTEVRGDLIRWVDTSSESAIEQKIYHFLDKMRGTLNQELFLPLQKFEIHLALYPPGAGYHKHWDRHPGVDHRIITFVLYLNSNWQEGDGGEIAIYDPKTDAAIATLPPLGGRLLLFQSALFPHEVLSSRKDRKSLTGWYRNDS